MVSRISCLWLGCHNPNKASHGILSCLDSIPVQTRDQVEAMENRNEKLSRKRLARRLIPANRARRYIIVVDIRTRPKEGEGHRSESRRP